MTGRAGPWDPCPRASPTLRIAVRSGRRGSWGTAYFRPFIVSVAVLSLPRRSWFHNRFLTWSSVSVIQETMWNESSTRSAFGRRSFTLASIHLAPSPVTALMEARCSSVSCRKNRSRISLPYPSCAQTTRLRLWSTTPIAVRPSNMHGGGSQAGGDPARDVTGGPPRDA